MAKVKVIGAGLAGCEAAWQIANAGFNVELYEMRPQKMTPAHHTGSFAELVCSNSLRSNQLENAVGLLKEELRILNSLIIESADKNSVPAGGALAVDRGKFSEYISNKVRSHPNIEVVNEEVTLITDDEYTIIATGPLTSDSFSQSIKEYLGEDYLYFYDAAAPIVTYDSINMDIAYKASRYGKGEDDYVNCPMSKDEYEKFYKELVGAETAVLKHFEKETVFEGCMPVEVMASRGQMTLLFGPLKPVGLLNPKTGEQPYAVVQLRQDNQEGTLYNIVGFQTHLKWSEQKRVFSIIPGLENAEFARYGVMHRNTFINSPKVLKNTLQTTINPKLMFAGQITGVEGYVESTSSGMVAGINMSRILQGKNPIEFPKNTAHGSLCNYITDRTIKSFQPMNINFGIFEPLMVKYKNKQEKNREYSKIALENLDRIIKSF